MEDIGGRSSESTTLILELKSSTHCLITSTDSSLLSKTLRLSFFQCEKPVSRERSMYHKTRSQLENFCMFLLSCVCLEIVTATYSRVTRQIEIQTLFISSN